jgi:23S rRNA-/tRNA-specific pseudouridylate synthase
MQHIGCPLLGDTIYLTKDKLVSTTKLLERIGAENRLYLVAGVLEFIHPTTKKEFALELDFPASFEKIVEKGTNATVNNNVKAEK